MTFILVVILGLFIGYLVSEAYISAYKQWRLNYLRKEYGLAPRPVRLNGIIKETAGSTGRKGRN